MDEIVVLDESLVSMMTAEPPKKEEDDGLTEIVVKKVVNPKLIGEDEIEITRSPFVIGKDEKCTFTIKGNKFISRKHCRIVRRQDGYYIEDLNSTNGTFIEGERIKNKVRLEDGQEVRLADREYKWVESDIRN